MFYSVGQYISNCNAYPISVTNIGIGLLIDNDNLGFEIAHTKAFLTPNLT